MQVSKDNQFLAILDENNVGAVFRANQNLDKQRPISYHDFRGAPSMFTVLCG